MNISKNPMQSVSIPLLHKYYLQYYALFIVICFKPLWEKWANLNFLWVKISNKSVPLGFVAFFPPHPICPFRFLVSPPIAEVTSCIHTRLKNSHFEVECIFLQICAFRYCISIKETLSLEGKACSTPFPVHSFSEIHWYLFTTCFLCVDNIWSIVRNIFQHCFDSSGTCVIENHSGLNF